MFDRHIQGRDFFTHAWLPKDKFDEVVESDGWIFARKGDGYLALRSQNPYFWNEPHAPQMEEMEFEKSRRINAEDVGREAIVRGKQNIWVCQMGSKTENGEFASFMESVSAAEISFDGMTVQYLSPGNGMIKFGWDQLLSVDQIEVQLNHYRRYENPYSQTEFNRDLIKIAAGDNKLELNWITRERRTG